MSKPEWGIKRVCPSCGTKYYDFNKNPIICPKCEFEFDPDLLLKSRKGRSIATKTEEPQVSSDAKKEDKTLEDDINSLENEEEILEIDENQEELEEPDLDVNLNQNIEESVDNDEMDIIEDNLDQKEDDFSIEIEEDDSSKEDKK
ncbi:MAG: TIGR02300 family protein [SAR116 cluster bacterium]|nr:TIGR02300 family protein [SAR116 cluster bacterium]RPH09461.1 MAG: TIGR02300 family protein [Alphaproteobacteria bacterium TMED54]